MKTKTSLEQTAKRIAKAIMTIDLGLKSAVAVERIALMKKKGNSEENMGGRNQQSVERVILSILRNK